MISRRHPLCIPTVFLMVMQFDLLRLVYPEMQVWYSDKMMVWEVLDAEAGVIYQLTFRDLVRLRYGARPVLR